jgi:hypothetical protein
LRTPTTLRNNRVRTSNPEGRETPGRRTAIHQPSERRPLSLPDSNRGIM